MRYLYCPLCGKKLEMKDAGDDGKVPFCLSCKKYWFDSFSDAVIIMIVNEFDEIVLLKQGYMSDKYTSFVSGYITPGETAEKTAIREVQEEIGVTLTSLEYDGTVWFEKNELLMHCFVGHTKKCEFMLSPEVDSAEWVYCEDVIKTLFPESPGNAAFIMYKKFMDNRKK